MKKIESLTIEQLESINPFCQKWIPDVLADTPDDVLFRVQKEMAKELNLNPLVLITDSPISGALAILMLDNQLDSQLGSQLNSQLSNQLYDQLGSQFVSQLHNQFGNQLCNQLNNQLNNQLHSQLRSQLYDQFVSQLDNQLHDQLNNQLHSQLRSQLHSQLVNQLDNQLDSQLDRQLHSQLVSQLDSQLNSQLSSQLYSQLNSQLLKNWYIPIGWSAWCGYYIFAQQIGAKFDEKKLKLFKNYVTNTVCVFPFEKIWFVSRKPITKWKNNQLHCDSAPAYYFRDGYSMWFLNGVKVTKEIAETPARKLDPSIILKEQNAEVRREIVRKIGIERICEKLNAKVIDTVGDYELLMLDLQDGRTRPYLKMKNPSIGIYHIEGVDPKCKTIEQALNFRSGLNKWNPQFKA